MTLINRTLFVGIVSAPLVLAGCAPERLVNIENCMSKLAPGMTKSEVKQKCGEPTFYNEVDIGYSTMGYKDRDGIRYLEVNFGMSERLTTFKID